MTTKKADDTVVLAEAAARAHQRHRQAKIQYETARRAFEKAEADLKRCTEEKRSAVEAFNRAIKDPV